jgi:hypothetical protein
MKFPKIQLQWRKKKMADKEETVPEAEKENPNPVLVPPVDDEGNPIEPADPDADSEDDDSDDDDDDVAAVVEDTDRNDRGDPETEPPNVLRDDESATPVPEDNEDEKGPLNLG